MNIISTLQRRIIKIIFSADNITDNQRVTVVIPFLVAHKLKKIFANSFQKGYLDLMPNQRHPDKTTLSVQLPRELMQQIRSLAKERKTSVTEIVEYILWRETKDIVLTDEDHEQIKTEREAYIKKIDLRRKSDA